MTDRPRYPDFLCIGAQKGGTTWLFKNLRNHPGVCIPHKELNFFNFRGQGPGSMFRLPIWRNALRHQLVGRLFRQDWHRSRWYLRYLFRRRTDAWYASLFEGCGDDMTGDVTPAYSTLGQIEVRHVGALMPRAKIILLLRDPVERAWSHLRMDYEKGLWPFLKDAGGPVEELPLELLQRHFDSEFSTYRGNYPRMLRIWGAHFPAEQIFIGFKEEIDDDPLGFINRVAGFLGLDPPRDGWPFAAQRVNAMPQMQIPAEVARYLSGKYLDSLKVLEQHPCLPDQPYVSAWRQRAEKRLA